MASVCQVCFLWLLLCVSGTMSLTEGALTAVYMPTSCSAVISVSPSLQLESSTRLTYTNNMNCYVSFTAASPFRLMAHITRFELEQKYSGSCSDYVNFHDGSNVTSSTLNNDVLCGDSLTTTLYVTSGQELTVHFITDSSAVYLGFNIIVTAATAAPCGSGQFLCNSSSFCIDSDLVCDNYQQCGDGSDESNCPDSDSSAGENWTPLIVGLCLGFLALLLILALVVYRWHRRNQWRRFADDHINQDDLPDPDPAYPVTHKYFRGIRGHPELPPYHSMAEEEKEKEKEEEEEKKKIGEEKGMDDVKI